jgi:hypothetical protein
MQLKLTRSQRETGLMSKTAQFIINARVQLTAEEQACVQRHKLGRQTIYDSQAKSQLMERSALARASGVTGINHNADPFGILASVGTSIMSNAFAGAKSLAFSALASMKLSITINSLAQGQHIECKSLDELIGAENAIMTACQNLKAYIDTAARFDGHDELYDFATGQPVLIASSSPAMRLIEPPTSPMYIEAPVASNQPPVLEACAPTPSFAMPEAMERVEQKSTFAPFAWWVALSTQKKLLASVACVLAVVVVGLTVQQVRKVPTPDVVVAYYAEPNPGTTYTSTTLMAPGYVGPYYTRNGSFLLATQSVVDVQGERRTQAPCNHGIPTDHINNHPVFECTD